MNKNIVDIWKEVVFPILLLPAKFSMLAGLMIADKVFREGWHPDLYRNDIEPENEECEWQKKYWESLKPGGRK